MKVKNSDLNKEIRFLGAVGKIFFTSSPQKLEKRNRKWVKRRKKHYSKKENRFLARSDGSKMRLRIVVPKHRDLSKKVPCLLWLHGGGYIKGTPEMMKFILPPELKKQRDCIIVAPDYRLSVEAPYPAALEDAYQALKWVKDNADELGIRDDQIFVGGESAGGGLTAALCLYARDKHEVNIAYQMPLYPMLDYRSSTPSMKDNNAPIWGQAQNIVAWNIYLNGDTNKVSKYASPSIETDYTSLPPTTTFIGSVDAFRDETIEYVENLQKAGVPVKFMLCQGGFHSSESLVPWAKVSKEARRFFMEAFDAACEHYFAAQA